jgi:hypothetical protein
VTGQLLACDKDCRADVGSYIEATVDADIKNGQEERTHSCILLSPSGNMHGSLKCFDLKTGKVVIRRRVEQLPLPTRILNKAIEWGEKGKAQITKDSIQFLNRLGKQFEWDNDEVEDLQVVMNEPEKVQRDHGVPAEIPGIEIEDDYKAVPGPAVEHELEKESVDVRKRALAARANSGLNVVDTPLVTTRGVNSHGINDDAPVINLTRDYPLLPEKMYKNMKQQTVSDGNDSSDDKDNGMPSLRHQNDGDNSSDDEDDDEGKEYTGPVIEPETLRRGKRVRKQARYLVPNHKGQSYNQGVTFHQVSHLRVSEGEEIKGQFTGAGYSTNKRVLHFNFNEDSLCPTETNEEESDAYCTFDFNW